MPDEVVFPRLVDLQIDEDRLLILRLQYPGSAEEVDATWICDVSHLRPVEMMYSLLKGQSDDWS
jgi:hypothetical protein